MANASQLLNDCLKCRHRISRNATNCPKCGFEQAHCLICQGRIAPQSMLMGDNYQYPHRYHKECVKKLFSYPVGLSCKICGSQFPRTWLTSIFPFEQAVDSVLPNYNFHYDKCPNCGEGNPLRKQSSCKKCSLPILDFQDSCTEGTTSDRYHAICRPDISRKNLENLPTGTGGGSWFILWILVAAGILVAVLISNSRNKSPPQSILTPPSRTSDYPQPKPAPSRRVIDTITCILPDGKKVDLTLEVCRRNKGVIW